jgi:hypothetical protein
MADTELATERVPRAMHACLRAGGLWPVKLRAPRAVAATGPATRVPTRSAEAAAPAREGTGASPNCSVGQERPGPSGCCPLRCRLLHAAWALRLVCCVRRGARARHSALRVRCAFPTTVCRPRMRLRGCLARCCTGTGLAPARSAPALGSPLPHLHLDWARPCQICTWTGLAPATSGPGLGSPQPHLHRDWAHPSHICTGTGLTPITSGPGRSPLPDLHWDWGSPLPHLHRDWAHPLRRD